MTIYITQGRYTREAIRGMIAKPEDRAEAAAGLVKAAGGELLNYYVTFGEYDFLVIMENDKGLTDIMSVLFAAAASGGVTDLRTTVAVTSKDATKAMKQAKKVQVGFRGAGQAA
jgi:uncharacterized protein with GYD domain